MKTLFLALMSLVATTAQAGEFKILPVEETLLGTITKAEVIQESHSFLHRWVGANVSISLEEKRINIVPYCQKGAICIQGFSSFDLIGMSRMTDGTVVYKAEMNGIELTIYSYAQARTGGLHPTSMKVFYTTTNIDIKETSILLAEQIKLAR